MQNEILLSVKNLSISSEKTYSKNKLVNNISFNLYKNEILGVVGESGSGKSLTALSIMQLLNLNSKFVISGNIKLGNIDLVNTKSKEIERIRGKTIGIIFQEPMSSLNPTMRCGDQIKEILHKHEMLDKQSINDEIIRLLNVVKIKSPKKIASKYPHELSGGQQQRIMIAIAIACKPKVLIADEPTTALDVTVQKEIINLIKAVQKETKMSVIFISHDLALVSEIANRVLVLYKGAIVESGKTETIFKKPKNNYTKALIKIKPKITERFDRLPTIKDVLDKKTTSKIITKKERQKRLKILYDSNPILEIKDLEKEYFKKIGVFGKKLSFKVLKGISFKLYEGETLGIVGESGCGKSTLAKTIIQIEKETNGEILYRGKKINNITGEKLRKLRKEFQIIFQDPYSSLNPKITIGNAIMEPMIVHEILSNNESRKNKVLQLLKVIGLNESAFNKYPHEFSGGQRQRIGIARTIAIEPKLIVCDESVSALDVSVQAQILNLLNSLKSSYGFSLIFISHDLAVVKHMADRILIIKNGRIVEEAEADEMYKNPKREYTRKLLNSIPKGL
tara:strand:- start:127613 stop:129304 length:1692 start_codon:yes stop_codon:yes gene_type:complete